MTGTQAGLGDCWGVRVQSWDPEGDMPADLPSPTARGDGEGVQSPNRKPCPARLPSGACRGSRLVHRGTGRPAWLPRRSAEAGAPGPSGPAPGGSRGWSSSCPVLSGRHSEAWAATADAVGGGEVASPTLLSPPASCCSQGDSGVGEGIGGAWPSPDLPVSLCPRACGEPPQPPAGTSQEGALGARELPPAPWSMVLSLPEPEAVCPACCRETSGDPMRAGGKNTASPRCPCCSHSCPGGGATLPCGVPSGSPVSCKGVSPWAGLPAGSSHSS